MPIKWQPFRNFERKLPDSGQYPGPMELPEMFGEDGMMPFLPPMPFQVEEPSVDIYQDKNNLYLEVSLGGMKPENINISIENNILIIQGKSETKEEIKEKDYLRKEIKKGAFRRMIKLPVHILEKKASAEVAGGLLKITMPKASKAVSKASRVPIKIR